MAEALQEEDAPRKRLASFHDLDDESFEILPSKKRSTLSSRETRKDSPRSSTEVTEVATEQDASTKQTHSRDPTEKESSQDTAIETENASVSDHGTTDKDSIRFSTSSSWHSDPEPVVANREASDRLPGPKSSLVIRSSMSGEQTDTTSPVNASSETHEADSSEKPAMDEDDDEAQVESLIASASEPPTSSLASFPHIQDYLPYPFPHRHSSIDPPPMPDPHKVTVLEWITQQQNYLLDTMKERIERRLASMRQRNTEERKRLEKTLRS